MYVLMHMCVYIHICVHGLFLCIYIYTYIYMHVYIYIEVYVCMCFVSIYIYMKISVYVYICIHVYICMCIYICIYKYMHMYVYIYMWACALIGSRSSTFGRRPSCCPHKTLWSALLSAGRARGEGRLHPKEHSGLQRASADTAEAINRTRGLYLKGLSHAISGSSCVSPNCKLVKSVLTYMPWAFKLLLGSPSLLGRP